MSYRVHNLVTKIDGKQTNTGYTVAHGRRIVHTFDNSLSGFNQAIEYAQALNLAARVFENETPGYYPT